MTDAEETAASTNPNDSQSVPWKALGSWRFSSGTFTGDDGQQPIAQSNVSIVSNGFDGSGVRISSRRHRIPQIPCSGNIREAEHLPRTGQYPLSPQAELVERQRAWINGHIASDDKFRGEDQPDRFDIDAHEHQRRHNGNECANLDRRRVFWDVLVLLPGYLFAGTNQLVFDAPSTRVTGSGIAPPANLNRPEQFSRDRSRRRTGPGL